MKKDLRKEFPKHNPKPQTAWAVERKQLLQIITDYENLLYRILHPKEPKTTPSGPWDGYYENEKRWLAAIKKAKVKTL